MGSCMISISKSELNTYIQFRNFNTYFRDGFFAYTYVPKYFISGVKALDP